LKAQTPFFYRVKIVAAAIIEKDGKVLIARRALHSNHAGMWEFPGGKVEEGETPQECLARELFEELNIRGNVGNHLCSSEYQYEHGSFKIEAFYVQWMGEITVLKDHDRVEWVKSRDLESYELLPADIPIARLLAKLQN